MKKALLLVALTVAVASCGQNSSGELRSAQPTTAVNDPVVSAAADVVQPVLASRYATTYAGLEVRGDTLVVHRKPDPALDAEIAGLAPHARILFQDARYTKSEMQAAVTRVMDDREHWKSRGADVNVAGPKTDGSGVEVGTAEEPPADLAAQLQDRYPGMTFSVRRQGTVVFPVYTGPVPVLPSSPVRSR
ncbi:hypothetical protein AB0A63_02575 [Lentzea sp. NPDC042327]|uniref:hypothetical protein n=1 Tax=Lentzea sp. NPDC042327 TaxID=3154801 RepID=UPI0033C33770